MSTDNTVNVYPQEVPSVTEPTAPAINPTINVLEFIDETKPGSRCVGYAKVEIHNAIPGFVIGMGKVSLYPPFDEEDETDQGKCRFGGNYKDAEDKWQAGIWFRAEELTKDGKEDKSLHYRLLNRIRKAIEIYRAGQEPSPTASFDALPQNIPISDEDIPF